jgi:hypothetical protein
MPNYTITPRVISSMLERARQLAGRRTAVMCEDFPLTLDEVQTGLLAPEVRVAVETIVNSGSMHILHVIRHAKVNIPDTTSYVQISCSEPLYHSAWNTKGEIVFYIDHLDPQKRLRLNEWCTKATQELNIAAVTYDVVKSYLTRGVTLTVAHVLAQWPTLSLLISGDQIWTERFNAPPKNLKRYQWQLPGPDHTWLAKYRKAMKLADIVLTSAVMLPEPSSKVTRGVTASVVGVVK